MIMNHHQLRERESCKEVCSAGRRRFQRSEVLFECENWKRFLEIMTAEVASCSLEIMTKSVFRDETPELQWYLKDNELPKIYLPAKPPTCSFVLNCCQCLWIFCTDGSSKPVFKEHPKNIWAWTSINLPELRVYWKHIWWDMERNYTFTGTILCFSPINDHLYW